jgi:hypothetical protein
MCGQRTVMNNASARVASSCMLAAPDVTSSHATANPSRHGLIAGINEFVGNGQA